jgi:hypothetical protein
MLNIKHFVIVLIIIFSFLSIAQTDNQSGSTKFGKTSGLIFEKEKEYRLDDSSYTDVIQLLNLDGKAQAIQFRILINKSQDDSTILIFKDIQKGSDLSDPSWLLDYNVIKGPVASNKASQDEIYVVLYNSRQDGGLLPGSHFDLINVNYEVADLTAIQKDIKSSMMISHAEASTFNGTAINIAPTKNEFKIYVRSK